MSCSHSYGITRNSFTTIPPKSSMLTYSTHSPNPWQLLIFLPHYSVPFLEWHIIGITEYAAFSDNLALLSNMHLRFMHIFSSPNSALFFYYGIICSFTYVSQCIHLLRNIFGVSRRVQFKAIMNKVSINTRFLFGHSFSNQRNT